MPNSLVGPTVGTSKKLEDLVLWEAEQRYTRKKAILKGVAAAGSVLYKIGTILKVSGPEYLAAVAGDTTAAAAILLDNVTLIDDATYEVPIMVNGPALVNEDELETPATTNLAAQKAALVALGIHLVKEPIKTSARTLE